MPARDGLARMDIDTGWAYHRKVRRLQTLYPEQWPIYWSAYMALLGEAWAKGREGRRLTVEDAWCPALPCTPQEATAALVRSGVTDKAGRIPSASWREWVEPVLAVFEAKRAGGVKGAARRWDNASPGGTGNGSPNSPARPPARPPARRGRASARGGRVDTAPTSLGEILRQGGAGWVTEPPTEGNDA